ncbi:hypothetical protein ACFX19_028763 [Malus domestica]
MDTYQNLNQWDRRNKEDDTYNCPSPSVVFKFGSQEGSNIDVVLLHLYMCNMKGMAYHVADLIVYVCHICEWCYDRLDPPPKPFLDHHFRQPNSEPARIGTSWRFGAPGKQNDVNPWRFTVALKGWTCSYKVLVDKLLWSQQHSAARAAVSLFLIAKWVFSG